MVSRDRAARILEKEFLSNSDAKDGKFHFHYLLAGEHTIEVRFGEDFLESQSFNIVAGESLELNFKFQTELKKVVSKL